MKVIFMNESRIYICQGDNNGTFVWCRSNETCKDNCQKKTSKFPKSFKISGCMSFKEPGEMIIVTSTINALVEIEILDPFLVSSIENWFGDEVIYQVDNAFCLRTKLQFVTLIDYKDCSRNWNK